MAVNEAGDEGKGGDEPDILDQVRELLDGADQAQN
jgi:hypothetical protein